MKEKAEKGAGGGVGAGPNAPTQPTSRIKEEGGDQGDNGHTSRPPSASLPNSGPLKKDPDSEIPQHRVKMEGPPSAHGPEDSGVGDLGVDGIKTEIDGLMDDGDPTKSPSCDLGAPGSLKSERLSSDSNDILDPQTGLRGPPGMQNQDPPSCRGPQGGPESMGPCRMGPGGPMSHMGPMNSGDSVQQPLPSNVIGKQTGSMEQSQIFVFSTLLANKGAEAVLQGHFQSIIAYHCAQPGTKKYLEKHPLKMGQFNKQNPAQWLNNFAMVKNRGAIRGSGGPNVPPNPNMGPNMGPNGGQGMPMMGNMVMGPGRMMGKGQMGNVCSGMGPMDGFPGPNSGPCSVMDNMVGDSDMPWDTKSGNMLGNGMSNSPHMGPSGPHCSEGGPGPTVPGHGGPGGPHTPSDKGGEPTSPSALLKLPSLQGVKIPDENLTPQQRAHREEQLATIRKMQQMLFPESGSMGAQGPHGHLDPNQQDGPPNSNIMTPTSQSGPQMGPGMGFPQGQMGGMGPGPNMGPGGPNMGPNGPNMGPNGPNMGPNGPNMGPNGPNMGPNGPMGPSGPNMGPNGPNCAMGPMGGNSMGGMQSHGPMGPNGMMGPMGSSMGPGGPFGPGPCMKGGRNPSCGGPDMKTSMCGDMHMSRTCGGPMGRMPNPMGGMGPGGPKPGPCMMGPGPRMMPGANINAMNGGIMMDSSGMGGPMGGPHGDCSGPMGPDSHMGMNGPMCDDFNRSRNFPPQMGPMDSHKLGLRSPRSPGDFDWQKIHQQFFEQHHPGHPHDGKNDVDGVKSPCSERGAPCPPPPPYGASPLHRSASVPIATQSPSHTPNSNIQMPHSAEPSRAGSTLNSPAPQGAPCPQGQNKGLSKNPGDGPQEEGVFVRQLQCLAQQQQQKSQGIKEANLMPVPSPQQIQYLNAFEGQELTIQKQPNTSIKEGSQNQNAQNNSQNSQSMNSNQKSPAGGMPGTPDPHCSSMMDQRNSRFSMEQSPGFPGSNNPLTPNSGISSAEKQRPSPQSNRSGQDPNSKTPQRDQMGPGHPSQPLNQGPYAPSSQQSHPNTMTSPNHPMSQQNANFKGSNGGGGPNGGNGGPNSLNGNMGPGKMVMGESDIGAQGPGGPGPPDMNPLTRNQQMGSQGFPGPCSMAPRPDNIPINPNQNPGSSFDPISSLAQMSQQLTNSVGGGPSGPGGMGPGGMGPGSMGPGMGHFGGAHAGHMQHHGHMHPGHGMMMSDMGCHMDSMGPGGGMGGPMDSMMGPGDFSPEMNMSPKMGGGPHMGGQMGPMDPSMMGPRMGPGGKMAPFNGANVQVKASAPNTIQYLPTRSQMQCNANPRGPPSLDFLQRVTNPMHMEAKAANINMQYFPGSPCGGPNMNTRMEMNEQMNAMSGMRPQGSMMGGGPMRVPGMLRMPHGYPGGFNSPPKMAGDPYSGANMVPNPNMMCNPNFRPQMMKGPLGPGPMGGAPMGMRAPTTTQPLPPSMGGPGNFKNSQNFVVPSTADPNYAQQFHNFQQQLYATGTRSQNAQGPPGPQGPPMGPGAGSPYGGYGVAK